MRQKTLILTATLALLGAACTTTQERRTKPVKSAQQKAAAVKTAKPMTDSEVTEDEPVRPATRNVASARRTQRQATAAGGPAGPSAGGGGATLSGGSSSVGRGGSPVAARAPAGPTASELAQCQNLIARTAAYRTLFAQLAPGTYAASGTTLDRIVQAQPADCNDRERRQTLYAAITTQFAAARSGRIGVVLPLSGQDAKYATFVVNGLRAAVAEAGGNFDQQVVLKDSAGSAQVTLQRLAELVFKDDVSLIVGGLEHADAEVLGKWSADLMLPTLVLNRDRDLAAPSKYAFMLYPDEKRLADTLAQAAQRRGWKRFAVLKPSSGKSNHVADYFEKAVQANGGQIVHDLTYTSGNFETMMGVSRQLFKADAEGRGDEYRKAYKKAKEESEKEGVPFDPRQVILKPIIDFDAVFIPDDFRTVRYFAKLFRYNLVDHLPMIGNHEWRSPALVDPYDDFLDGSLFADFIGSYAKLPAAVGAPTMGSPYFIQPQSVVAVDFQLIGYRAGRVAEAASKTDKSGARPNHKQLAEALARVDGDAAGFFASGPAFDTERRSNWPTYVFTVAHRTLELESTKATASVASEH